MSVYFTKGKGWRYDFTLTGTRYTQSGFKTKTEAKRAEAKRKEDIQKPKETTEIPTDMGFLELLNKRLDFVKAYHSERHYSDYLYLARKWAELWCQFKCNKITADMIQDYLIKRSEVSAYTANKDLRYLRAVFNFGIKRRWISKNPTSEIQFLPVNKTLRYVPPTEDVLKVIIAADPEIKDYLFCIMETMARMGEINCLTWSDIDFRNRCVILYTRKKRGGHRTPRRIPMTDRLYNILDRRFKNRDKSKPWIFWHRYWSRKKNTWIEGPFKERKKIMGTLCKKAGVKYFRFHALRHFGASVLENANVNIGSIQRILGHENRSTTEIYLHSIGESERNAMRVYEQSTKFSHTDSHTKAEQKNRQSDTIA